MLLRPGLAQAAPPRFTLDPGLPAGAHHEEGRVVALEFATLRLLLTYTPNSGKTGAKQTQNGGPLRLADVARAEESLARRRAFDVQLLRFVAAPHAKPLLWCGDLNVAPDSQLDLAPSPARFVAEDIAGSRPDEQVRRAMHACRCGVLTC